ncbi:MAG TPA: GNAT family N-acetyltransferase [Mycobacteriales bacterium]|nr:GNAT family N-acetyltransferase [Mycobacteriales bacterium]
MTTTISRAESAEEVAAAYDVRRWVFVDEQRVPLDLERDEADETADHFLACDGATAVGAARLVRRGQVGVLGRLAVLPAARGRHLGVALVHAIERHVRACGLATIELHAQTPVRGFYEALGYAPYGAEFLEAGIPHVSMRKYL